MSQIRPNDFTRGLSRYCSDTHHTSSRLKYEAERKDSDTDTNEYETYSENDDNFIDDGPDALSDPDQSPSDDDDDDQSALTLTLNLGKIWLVRRSLRKRSKRVTRASKQKAADGNIGNSQTDSQRKKSTRKRQQPKNVISDSSCSEENDENNNGKDCHEQNNSTKQQPPKRKQLTKKLSKTKSKKSIKTNESKIIESSSSSEDETHLNLNQSSRVLKRSTQKRVESNDEDSPGSDELNCSPNTKKKRLVIGSEDDEMQSESKTEPKRRKKKRQPKVYNYNRDADIHYAAGASIPLPDWVIEQLLMPWEGFDIIEPHSDADHSLNWPSTCNAQVSSTNVTPDKASTSKSSSECESDSESESSTFTDSDSDIAIRPSVDLTSPKTRKVQRKKHKEMLAKKKLMDGMKKRREADSKKMRQQELEAQEAKLKKEKDEESDRSRYAGESGGEDSDMARNCWY